MDTLRMVNKRIRIDNAAPRNSTSNIKNYVYPICACIHLIVNYINLAAVGISRVTEIHLMLYLI